MKRRLIDAAAVGGLGLLFHLIACRLWGAHRAGSVDPFGYAGGWEEIAFAYTAPPMLILGALLGGSGRCPAKSLRAIISLALLSGLLLAGVHVYTRHWALSELLEEQGGLIPAATLIRC